MTVENSRHYVQPQQGEENKWWPIFFSYTLLKQDQSCRQLQTVIHQKALYYEPYVTHKVNNKY